METFFYILVLVGFFLLFIFIVEIPYKIARSRKVEHDSLMWIRVLCWLGIFFGLTWIAAFIWAFFAEKETEIVAAGTADSLDSLEKLKNLLDSGAITEEEFEAKKKILLDRLR